MNVAVRHLPRSPCDDLARLTISEAEAQQVLASLDAMLGYVGRISHQRLY